MEAVNVQTETCSYEIIIAIDLMHSPAAQQYLQPLLAKRQCLLVTDSNVQPLYAQALTQLLRRSEAVQTCSHSISAGENSKNLATVENLYHFAVEHCLDRDATVLALGGGVVGDLAGFFAATYMRGIGFIQVPTSLLAMVDSSVGGKVGVDLPEGKNLVGAFLQPQLVLSDTTCLRTLPQRELRCGLAEVVKYGVIMAADLFAQLEANTRALQQLDLTFYGSIIKRCCQLKGEVVREDERESGRRAILNYGHTFGHALEQLGGYQALNHGEAVAIGMAMAADLAADLGLTTGAMGDRQNALLAALGLPTSCTLTLTPGQVLAAMRHDKKAKAGKLRLILPNAIGAVEIVSDPDEAAVLRAIGGRLG